MEEKKIEKARELFLMLEDGNSKRAADIAKRSFLIQQRLSEIRN